jgi:hypothetical protein
MSELFVLPASAKPIKPPPPVVPVAIPRGAPSIEWLVANCKMQLVAYLLFITPEIAKAFLEANTGNRGVKKRHLARLIAAMKNGEWIVTHQGICFSITGVLLDGQHRLLGIIESGVGQFVHVFVGFPDAARKKMDDGIKPRELRDVIDGDQSHIDACAFLAGLMITSADRPPSANEVEALMDALEDDLNALHRAYASKVKGRTPAPIRAVWAVRHHQANKAGKKLLEAQWKAFGSLYDMDTTTATAVGRLGKISNITGTGLARERAKIAWMAFDPSQRAKKSIQVRSDNPIWEIREALQDILEEET